MGLINIPDLSDNTGADANDVNSRMATILSLVNGNIDNANIKAGGVTAANLATGSVTNSKLSTADGDIGGAWQSYTPTFGSLSGGTTNYAVYMQVGKRVDFKLKYTLGGAGVSGAVTFSLPVAMASRTAATTDVFNVNVELNDTSGNAYLAGAAWLDANTMKIFALSASGSYVQYTNVSSTVPFTWASTDYILVSGSYEAA